MVHFSQVLGIPVSDAAGRRIGKADDLQFDPANGLVRRLIIARSGALVLVPWQQVDLFSPETRRIGLAAGAELQPSRLEETDCICLRRNVLDRQIIDISGRKVVRVNDVTLEMTNGDLYLRHVEIGLAGAVRRLMAGVASPRVVRQVASGLSERSIPWEYVGLVEPKSAQIRLKVHQNMARLHPADVADIIEDLGRIERKQLVSILDTETAAQALSEVEAPVQATVVEDMQIEKAADLLEEMQPDEAADILGELPEERSQALLAAMQGEEAEDVRQLLTFDEDVAGGLMSTEFLKADPAWTVAQTLEVFRQADPDLLGEMDEIPLVDEKQKLVGMVPLVRLVRHAPDELVTAALRRDDRAVLPTTPLEEVVERFEKYHLRGLAVTDEFGTLIGLISIEDVLSRLAEKG
jgi:magnesium transporter